MCSPKYLKNCKQATSRNIYIAQKKLEDGLETHTDDGEDVYEKKY